jgi:hypothetical protein
MKPLSIKTLFLFNLLFYLISPATQALADSSLYTGQLLVSNSSPITREQAIPQILQQVLIKVSNHPNIISLERIGSKLTNASSLIESYSYTSPNDKTTNQLILTIQFDQLRVDQFLKKLENKTNQPITTTQLTIMVKNIKNLDNYTMVNRYFSTFATITKVEDIDIGNNYIKLKITSTEGLVELANAISAGNVLAVVPNSEQDQDINLTCYLR